MFRLEINRKALKALEKLDEKRRKRFTDVFSILKEDPVPFRKLNVAKLRGYESTYRIRIGDLRLVYTVYWAERRILIHFIGTRRKAY